MSFTQTTTYQYGQDNPSPTVWDIGLVTGTSVTHTTPVLNETLTRTSRASYVAGTHLPATTIDEPSGQNLNNGQFVANPLSASYSYNGYGEPTGVTVSASDIATRTGSMGWSANGGFPTSMTNALSQTSTAGFDPGTGAETSATDPNKLTVMTTIDALGRPTLMIHPDGTRTAIVYFYCSADYMNNGTATCPTYGMYLLQSTPENSSGTQIGPQVTAYFDMYNRVIQRDTQSFNGSLSRVTTSYDDLGRVSQVSQPFFARGGPPVYTVATYDQLNRVTRVTSPDSSTASHAYHGPVTVDSDNSQTLTSYHDSLGEVTLSVDALNNSTTYEYDPFSHLQLVRDPGGNTTAWSFDIRGHKIVKSDPDTGNSFWNYDSLGEVTQSQTQVEHNNGQATTYQYDVLGRMKGRTEPDMVTGWTYDAPNAIGRLYTATTTPGASGNADSSNYTRTHYYDSLARPIETTHQFVGFDGEYQESYNSNGQLATQTSTTSMVVSYEYNSYGYVSQILHTTGAVGAGPSVPYYTVNSRDAAGRPLSVSVGNAAFSNAEAETSIVGGLTDHGPN